MAGLDRDGDLRRIGFERCDRGTELADPLGIMADASSPADRALRIDDADIVVVARPIDAAVEHRCSPSLRPACDGLMDEPSWGDTLPVRSGSDLCGSGTV